ncbi:MAG TPA: DUF192 domain-containing protein [Caulobacteraceae bacterium]|nr:DUF192 domain-containing protein [Caulobacteraceae bacterium]
MRPFFSSRGLGLAAACALLLAVLPVRAQDDGPITRAQPTLKVENLDIVTHTGVHHFRVEIAATPRQQEVGLMFRPAMAAGRGMLFEMGPPQQASFWMKNCPVPLDMLFIRADGRVLRVAADAAPYSEAPIASGGAITGVLELRGGRAAEIDAEPGDVVRHPYFHDE